MLTLKEKLKITTITALSFPFLLFTGVAGMGVATLMAPILAIVLGPTLLWLSVRSYIAEAQLRDSANAARRGTGEKFPPAPESSYRPQDRGLKPA